jgi:hypothetical protein
MVVIGRARAQNRTNGNWRNPDSGPSNLAHGGDCERLAREQGRSVSQVLADAVSRYLRDEQWQRLKDYGRERATAMGLTEADVPRLIDQSRRMDSINRMAQMDEQAGVYDKVLIPEPE